MRSGAIIKLKLLLLVLMNAIITRTSLAQHSALLCNNGITPIKPWEHSIIKDSVTDKPLLVYPPATKDFKKLTINTSIYLGTSLLVSGVLYLLPEDVSGWKKNEIKTNNLFRKWSEHVKEGPMVDNDKAYINYLAHPYAGAVYYMTARGCGFKSYACFLYSAAMSTFFWEYGVEAFAQVPSTQDLLITPIAGAAIGEGFFYMKKEILQHDRRVLHSKFLGFVSLFIVDPFNTILDGAGYKEKIKTQINISPDLTREASRNAYLRLSFSAFL
jgi:hypothetical protein